MKKMKLAPISLLTFLLLITGCGSDKKSSGPDGELASLRGQVLSEETLALLANTKWCSEEIFTLDDGCKFKERNQLNIVVSNEGIVSATEKTAEMDSLNPEHTSTYSIPGMEDVSYKCGEGDFSSSDISFNFDEVNKNNVRSGTYSYEDEEGLVSINVTLGFSKVDEDSLVVIAKTGSGPAAKQRYFNCN